MQSEIRAMTRTILYIFLLISNKQTDQTVRDQASNKDINVYKKKSRDYSTCFF